MGQAKSPPSAFWLVGKSFSIFFSAAFLTHLFKLLLYRNCGVKDPYIALEKYFMSASVENLRQDNLLDGTAYQMTVYTGVYSTVVVL